MTEEELNKIKEKYPEKPIGRCKNLTGQIFGKLKALYKTTDRSDIQNGNQWVCECQCDNHTILLKLASDLNRGRACHCGCNNPTIKKCGKEYKIKTEIIDYINNNNLSQLYEKYPIYSGAVGNRFNDLSNNIINNIFILYRVENEQNVAKIRARYLCKCHCGNFFTVRGENLTKNDRPSLSCGYCDNFKFSQKKEIGDFYILNTFHSDTNGDRDCCTLQCKKCGYIFYPRKTDLYNKIEYNCAKCNTSQTNKNFKIGDKIGKLTLLSFMCNEENKIRWRCKCDCGKEIELTTCDLNKRKSCGNCIDNGKDILGEKFGKLTVIEVLPEKKNHNYIYKCQCECGNFTKVQRGNLLLNHTHSCGCTGNSYHEKNIADSLCQINIPFITQYTDHPLKSIFGKSLRFDFYINNKYIIEYDGGQHFYYRDKGWNNEENYLKTHEHDLIKNKYCFDNNIPLIRIPYDADYTIDDLKLETTRFLLTSENEKEYYESRK